jgi:hypothetical protein
MQAEINELRELLPALSESDRNFAGSLLDYHARKGFLTPGQQPWIRKLIDKAKNPPVTKTQAVGNLSGVRDLLGRAKRHLKSPAVVLGVAKIVNGEPVLDYEVRINEATQRARVPGSLNVVRLPSAECDRTWYGRILSDGTFEHSRRDEPPAKVGELLTRFAADPVETALAHGKLTGRCCFCNSALRDERSTAVGYGPTCAKSFELPWGTKAATPVLKAAKAEQLQATAA